MTWNEPTEQAVSESDDEQIRRDVAGFDHFYDLLPDLEPHAASLARQRNRYAEARFTPVPSSLVREYQHDGFLLRGYTKLLHGQDTHIFTWTNPAGARFGFCVAKHQTGPKQYPTHMKHLVQAFHSPLVGDSVAWMNSVLVERLPLVEQRMAAGTLAIILPVTARAGLLARGRARWNLQWLLDVGAGEVPDSFDEVLTGWPASYPLPRGSAVERTPEDNLRKTIGLVPNIIGDAHFLDRRWTQHSPQKILEWARDWFDTSLDAVPSYYDTTAAKEWRLAAEYAERGWDPSDAAAWRAATMLERNATRGRRETDPDLVTEIRQRGFPPEAVSVLLSNSGAKMGPKARFAVLDKWTALHQESGIPVNKLIAYQEAGFKPHEVRKAEATGRGLSVGELRMFQALASG